MKRTLSVVLGVAVAVILAAVYSTRKGHAPASQPAILEMNASTVSALQAEFNRTADKLRVILLLSPT
jgi:hypothetical protein